MSQPAPANSGSPSDAAKLALDRTFLAHERTLLAWVRTATSLITFGFTLYKFFYSLQEIEHLPRPHQLIGARGYGLIMMGIGVFTLAMATWQHRQLMKPLRAAYPEAPFSLSAVLAGLIAGLGILGFLAAVFRQ